MKDDAKSKRTASTRRTSPAKKKQEETAPRSADPGTDDSLSVAEDSGPENVAGHEAAQSDHRDPAEPPRLDEVSANASLLAPDEEALAEKRNSRQSGQPAEAKDGAPAGEAASAQAAGKKESEEDDFGPTLAAWLAAYRARQGEDEDTAASQPVKPQRPPLRVANRPAMRPSSAQTAASGAARGQEFPADTGVSDAFGEMPRPSGTTHRDPYAASHAAHAAWADHAADRAYWDESTDAALSQRMAHSPGQHPAWMGPPPSWMVGHSDQEQARPHRGSRFLAIGMIAFLSVGAGALALVAAARNNDVDIGLDGLMATIDQVAEVAESQFPAEPSSAALSPSGSAQVVERPSQPAAAPVQAAAAPARAVAEQPQARTSSPQPTIRVEQTRIVAAPPPREPSLPVSPSSTIGRSTVLLPQDIPADASPPLPDAGSTTPAAAPQPQAPVAAQPASTPPQPREQANASLVRPEQSAPAQMSPRPAAATSGNSGPAAEEQQPVRIASLQPTVIGLGSSSETAEQSSRGGFSKASSGDSSVDHLVERGRQLLQLGDVIAARLLFELAANQGSAEGAMGAGCTYNPVCFQTLGVQGIAADPERAMRWYRKALEAGATEASTEMATLESWMTR